MENNSPARPRLVDGFLESLPSPLQKQIHFYSFSLMLALASLDVYTHPNEGFGADLTRRAQFGELGNSMGNSILSMAPIILSVFLREGLRRTANQLGLESLRKPIELLPMYAVIFVANMNLFFEHTLTHTQELVPDTAVGLVAMLTSLFATEGTIDKCKDLLTPTIADHADQIFPNR